MRRAGLLALEAAGLLVAGTLACVGFLLWRVQTTPVDLGWASPLVRAAANAAAFSGAVADIDKVTLEKAGEPGAYRLVLDDVVLRRRASGASARLPHVDVIFHPKDFLSGRAGPRRVLVDGAALRIVRRADKRVKIDFGEGADERARVFQSLTGGAYFREAFEAAELKNISITFIDETSGRKWTGRNGEARVKRTPGGYAANLSSDFDLAGKSAALAFESNYDLSTEVISSKLDVDDAPVGDLIAVFFNENAELLTSPVSGSATVDLDKRGAVLSSRIDLSASGGALDLGAFSTPVEAIEVAASFDPAQNEFTIERANWRAGIGAGSVTGVVSLVQPADRAGVDRVAFTLSGERASFDLKGVLPEILPVDAFSVSGSYGIPQKRLDLEKVSASLFGLEIGGAFSFARTGDASPLVVSTLKIDGALSPQTLLELWPTKLALGARDFIAQRMPAGVFSGVDITVDMKEGAVGADGALPDEALSIAFRADDATVHYAPGMTPLTRIAGRGLLKGNSFRFDAERANVAAVRVVKGQVEIPVLMPKGEPAYFRFSAEGDAGAMLAVLDEEPLRVLKDTTFAASQFKGPVSATVEIQRPNLRVAPPEDYRYKGVASFRDLSVENIVAETKLIGVDGRLDLSTSGMTIKGDGRVGEAPVSINWKQRFFGAGDKTVITITGEADSAMADAFGVPTRQMVQGPVPFKAHAVGGVGSFRALELEADFTNAVLISEPLGWMKAQGALARGKATFAFSPDGADVTALEIAGDGVSIKGSASFATGGALKMLDVPTFELKDAVDVAIRGGRDASGVLSLSIDGKRLNAAEMIRKSIDEGFGGGEARTPISLSARIDQVDFRGGVSYRDAKLDFARSSDGIDTLSLNAKGETGKPLSIEMKAPADGDQLLSAKSDDIGALLGGLFAMSSVKGGYGELDFKFAPGVKNAPRAGMLEAHDIRVVKAPLLAKIFAAGSLTGLADLVNGEGIELQNARADFSFENGVLRISEARATGPSVGITAAGAYLLEEGRTISLKGAVAPAYQVNSFLGKAPVIGDLFVNRKGEGLLALSYDVDGPVSEPRVTVNPLSALAPGVLRRMFEGGQSAETTQAPPTD